MNTFQNTPSPSIAPNCTCCFPAQRLVTTGRQAYCPLTERIYENNTNGATINTRQTELVVDFYPGHRQKGEAAPFAINPAEDRFGKK